MYPMNFKLIFLVKLLHELDSCTLIGFNIKTFFKGMLCIEGFRITIKILYGL